MVSNIFLIFQLEGNNTEELFSNSSSFLKDIFTAEKIFAQDGDGEPIPPKKEIPWTGSTTLNNIFLGIATWIVRIGVTVTVVMFLWAAILFATAAGDPTKLSQAKKAVIWGLAGGIIVFLSQVMSWIVYEITGLSW